MIDLILIHGFLHSLLRSLLRCFFFCLLDERDNINIFCVRVVLWGFIEIIGIAVFTLHKIAFINQLYKLVTISGGRHTNSLTNGGGG